MTPELEALARRAVACPRWRWMPGMLTSNGERMSDEGWPLYDALDYGSSSVAETVEWHDTASMGALPDLTDPATLGCLLALVREAHGPSAVARHIGTHWRGGPEWGIYDRAPHLDGYHVAAPALGYWESEAEALVAALETGGGGE